MIPEVRSVGRLGVRFNGTFYPVPFPPGDRVHVTRNGSALRFTSLETSPSQFVEFGCEAEQSKKAGEQTMANEDEDVIEKYRPEIHALADELYAAMEGHLPGVIARAFLLALNRRALPEGMVFSLKRQPAVD